MTNMWQFIIEQDTFINCAVCTSAPAARQHVQTVATQLPSIITNTTAICKVQWLLLAIHKMQLPNINWIILLLVTSSAKLVNAVKKTSDTKNTLYCVNMEHCWTHTTCICSVIPAISSSYHVTLCNYCDCVADWFNIANWNWYISSAPDSVCGKDVCRLYTDRQDQLSTTSRWQCKCKQVSQSTKG